MALGVKNPPANAGETQEMWIQSLGREDPVEQEMAATSVLLPEKHFQKRFYSQIPD